MYWERIVRDAKAIASLPNILWMIFFHGLCLHLKHACNQCDPLESIADTGQILESLTPCMACISACCVAQHIVEYCGMPAWHWKSDL